MTPDTPLPADVKKLADSIGIRVTSDFCFDLEATRRGFAEAIMGYLASRPAADAGLREAAQRVYDLLASETGRVTIFEQEALGDALRALSAQPAPRTAEAKPVAQHSIDYHAYRVAHIPEPDDEPGTEFLKFDAPLPADAGLIREAIEALEFYADPKNWWNVNASDPLKYHQADLSGSMESLYARVGTVTLPSKENHYVHPLFSNDCGGRARATLATLRKAQNG